jgi:hypothetical protein
MERNKLSEQGYVEEWVWVHWRYKIARIMTLEEAREENAKRRRKGVETRRKNFEMTKKLREIVQEHGFTKREDLLSYLSGLGESAEELYKRAVSCPQDYESCLEKVVRQSDEK